MPRKKKQAKNLALSFDPASPPSAEGQALLDALRSNLSLLGEIAIRYEVNVKPERPEDPPSIGSPKDIHSLLGAGDVLPRAGAAAGAAARHPQQRHRPEGRLPGQREQLRWSGPRKSSGPPWSRPFPR